MATRVAKHHAAGSLALCSLLAACAGSSSGGALGTGGSAGTGGFGGSGGTGGVGGFAIPGSYDLVIDKVTGTPEHPGGPPAPPWTSPSNGQTMRLDLRKSASGSIAGILTPRWGTPAAMDGDSATGKYRFSGDTVVRGFDSNVNTSDHWELLEIAASGDGLDSKVTMHGYQSVIEGDVLYRYDLSGEATLGEDVTPPELRSEPASRRGPSDALLPWDPIEVDCAEPIATTVFEPKVSVLLSDVDHAGALTPVSITWSFSPTEDSASWAGIVRAEAHLNGWDHHPTQTAKPYTVQALAGITDPANLESGETSTSFAILDVGAPRPSFTFDAAGVPAPASWGLVAFRDGASSEATRCESGGCSEIGPFNTISCGIGRHGIAGRVEAPTGTLAVRYRLLFASDAVTPEEPPYPYGPAFTVEVATAGGEPIAQPIDGPSQSSLLDLGASAGEFRWATAWTTAFVALPGPVPPKVIDLGFSIGSAGSGFEWCSGGPLPPPVKTLLVIDSVSGQ